MWWANTNDWTDPIAVRHYRAALSKEVDSAIVTPGQDKPLWLSTPLGSVLGQFKSFGMASVQRTMLSGLQRRDANALNGLVMMVALGALATKLKNDVAGRESGDTVEWWVKEGFDRSGVTGWLFDVHNIVEKGTRGAIGLSQFTGGPTMSRYQSRNMTGALLGPSLGAVNDLMRVAGTAAQEGKAALTGQPAEFPWNQADTRAVRRLVPYQNLFYLRWLFDQAEEGINDTLGVRQ